MDPVWLAEAKRFKNLREIEDRRLSHPILDKMARYLGLNDFQDDEPWCTMFVAYCLKSTIPDIVLPRHLMWSRAFEKWGQELDAPRPGAVMVYWRGKSPKDDLGHVGFYLKPGLTYGYSKLISGNYSNMVLEHDMSDEKLVSIRWPIVGGE